MRHDCENLAGKTKSSVGYRGWRRSQSLKRRVPENATNNERLIVLARPSGPTTKTSWFLPPPWGCSHWRPNLGKNFQGPKNIPFFQFCSRKKDAYHSQ